MRLPTPRIFQAHKRPFLAAVLLIAAAAAPARAQFFGAALEIHYVTADPSGACVARFITVNTLTANVRGCVNSVWTDLLGGGGGGIGVVYTVVPYSATPTYTVSLSALQTFHLDLTGNVTSATLNTTDATVGQTIIIQLCQDTTGNRTVAWPVNVINYGTVDPTANACSKQAFIWDGSGAVASSVMVSDADPPALIVSAGALILPPAPDYLVGQKQLTAAIAGNAATQYTPDGLISGGTAVYQSGLSFRVGTAAYTIGGTRYTTAETTLTLTAADVTNPRIDVIAVNSSGAAVVIAGTPAASPAKPAVDPDSQIELTFVYVAAGATTPSNVTLTDVYHENVEWTATKSGAGFNVASTSNPHAGTLDIEGTAVTTGDFVKLTAAAPFDLATRSNLALYIRSKATFASTRTLTLAWYLNNTRKGAAVTLTEGSFGFSSGNTSAYQQIVVPLSLFGANGLSVDNLRITVAGTGATIGFYLDDLTLQGGVTAPASTASIVRGLVFTFDGGGAAISSGATAYARVPFACTLVDWSISSTTAETVTLKTWKVSTGTALPTVSNSISTAGVSLSSGKHVRSTTLADFTQTSVSANDIVAANITAVTSSQWVQFSLGCQQ